MITGKLIVGSIGLGNGGFDVNNFTLAIDKYNIKRYKGVFHPENLRQFKGEDKDHATIRTEGSAVH